jgi:hypothetical protein
VVVVVVLVVDMVPHAAVDMLGYEEGKENLHQQRRL